MHFAVPTTSACPGRWEVTPAPLCACSCFLPHAAGGGCCLRLFHWGVEEKNCNVLNFDLDKMYFLWLLSLWLKRDHFWQSVSSAGSCCFQHGLRAGTGWGKRGETEKQPWELICYLSGRIIDCFLEAPCKEQRSDFSVSFLLVGVTFPSTRQVKPGNSSHSCGLRNLLQLVISKAFLSAKY